MILMNPLAGPIASAVAILAITFGVAQCSAKVEARRELAQVEKRADAVERDLRTCRSSVTSLSASVEAQNAAVTALRREGEAKVAASRKAAQDARAVAESYRRAAGDILKAKPASADSCEAAAILIRQVSR
ncbi:MAG: hypothetical protein DI570_09955 [Phenylobacterium zucineum]|nr:MAG: hypothetical protein DI570_09955 [Phenylobacterium zucineum]